MSRTLHISIMLLLVAAVGVSQPAAKKKSIEGVWKMVEVVGTGNDAFNISNPQPSLLIITRGHYSEMYAVGDGPRKLFQSLQVTDAEKVEAFNTFVANSGTYELNGNIMTIRPIVAKMPNYMGGGFAKFQVRTEGNNLWITEKSEDTSMIVGGKIVPLAAPGSTYVTKYVRVE